MNSRKSKSRWGLGRIFLSAILCSWLALSAIGGAWAEGSGEGSGSGSGGSAGAGAGGAAGAGAGAGAGSSAAAGAGSAGGGNSGGYTNEEKFINVQSEIDRARAAVSAGYARSLINVMREALSVVHGQVLDAHLYHRSNGKLAYAITVLTPKGRYIDLEIDALHNVILSVKER